VAEVVPAANFHSDRECNGLVAQTDVL
jgi:hypothetical protein